MQNINICIESVIHFENNVKNVNCTVYKRAKAFCSQITLK